MDEPISTLADVKFYLNDESHSNKSFTHLLNPALASFLNDIHNTKV